MGYLFEHFIRVDPLEEDTYQLVLTAVHFAAWGQ